MDDGLSISFSDTPRGAWSHRKPESRPVCDTPLRAWCVRNGTSAASLARLLGCNVRTARCWINGQCLPSIVYAYKIDELTRGEVPPASWLGTEHGKAAWAAAGRAKQR